jgi:UV DNA damage endonuclease
MKDNSERRYGYCCINMTLAEKGISTNRSMVKKTFLEKGIAYASEISLKNVKDLVEILKWNSDNGVKMFRMSSDIFPWCSEYEFTDLPDFSEISSYLRQAGDLAKESKQRLTFHPSPYCVIASERPDVVEKSFKELRQHGEIMDLMGLERSHFYPINIHINTSKPSKEMAAERFCSSYMLLPETAKSRLVLEVDDKKSQFTSSDLYNLVHKKVGVPLTFDYLHNLCNPPADISEMESLSTCLSSWPEKIRPIVHYSDSKKIYEDSSSKELAHTDWIWNKVETYDLEFDIEFEVKMKDLALLKYLKEKMLMS